MDTEKKNVKTGFKPIIPFEHNHPDMLIGTEERDKRLNAESQCEYCLNNETFD